MIYVNVAGRIIIAVFQILVQQGKEQFVTRLFVGKGFQRN